MERLAWISTENGTMRAVKQLPAQFAHAQRWASLSPDGEYIAYSRTQGNSANRDIFMVSADGMHETLLVTHAADDFVMGWSSDSRRLVFASNRNGTTDLWRMDVVDGKAAGIPQRLKRDLGQVEPMGIHGRTLYYRFGEFLTDSYEATVDPVTGKLLGTPSPIGESFGSSFSSPDWSPDGRRVVHIVLPAAFGQPPSERSQQTSARLFVLSPETGEERQIAPQLKGIVRPRWHPNGKTISVQARGEDRREGIFNVDPDSGSVTALVSGERGSGIRNTGWSVNGSSIVFEKYFRVEGKTSAAVITRRVDTGEERQIFLDCCRGKPSLVAAVSPVNDQW